MLWKWILVIVFGIFLIFIFKRMPIEIMYAFSAAHEQQKFNIKIYGIELWRQKNKKKDKDKKKDKTKDKKNDDKKDNKQKKSSFSGFMNEINRVKEVYEAGKNGLIKVLKYLGKKTKIKNFTIHLEAGFENAAHTGIAGGAAYATVYGAAGLVYNNTSIKKENLDIEVVPQFNRECVNLYTKTALGISIAQIIVVLVILLRTYMQIKKKINKKQ